MKTVILTVAKSTQETARVFRLTQRDANSYGITLEELVEMQAGKYKEEVDTLEVIAHDEEGKELSYWTRPTTLYAVLSTDPTETVIYTCYENYPTLEEATAYLPKAIKLREKIYPGKDGRVVILKREIASDGTESGEIVHRA